MLKPKEGKKGGLQKHGTGKTQGKQIVSYFIIYPEGQCLLSEP
jgi:hypothetical protein